MKIGNSFFVKRLTHCEFESRRKTDIEHFYAERGRRGNKLPRGYQRVERIEIIEKTSVGSAEPDEE